MIFAAGIARGESPLLLEHSFFILSCFWTFLSYEPYSTLTFRITSSIATIRPAYMWRAKCPYPLKLPISC